MGHPFLGGAGAGDGFDHRFEDGPVLHTQFPGGETLVLHPLLSVEGAAEASPEAVIHAGENHVTIGRGIGTVGDDAVMAGTDPPRVFSAHQIQAAEIAEEAGGAVEQTDVDAFALAGAGPLGHRAEDTHGGINPAADVTQGNPEFGRRTIGLAVDTHQSAHGLGDHIHGTLIPQRTVLAKAGDGTVDDVRFDLFNLIVGQAQTFHDTRPVVLHQHIGRAD